jgi:nucleoside-diphosphate-sugar epimerase
MKTRIFVTGATGYIGSAVVARLARDPRYEVHGLTRSIERARVLEAHGVHAVVGDLQASPEWLGVMQNCDAVVHCAFDLEHGASDRDAEALEAVRSSALDGRVRRLLYTSGIWVVGPTDGAVLDETAPLHPLELAAFRVAHEAIALDLDAHEVETVVLRPGMVHGEARGTFGAWWQEARTRGTVPCPGGDQHWPVVHRDDVAEGYALALEHGQGGECYLLTDESRLTVRELAAAAAAASGASVRPQTAAEVVAEAGLFGKALLCDQQFTAAKARRELGWVPRHASFIHEAPALWAEFRATREAPVA